MRTTTAAENAVAEQAVQEPDAGPNAAPPPPGVPRAAIIAAVLSVALVLAGIGAAALGGGGTRLRVTAGENVAVNQDTTSINAHNSPAIAQSPSDANLLAVTARVDRPRFSASVDVSRDGGRTWTDVPLTLPAGEDRPFAPDVAFGAGGDLHVLFSTLTGPGNTPGALWIETSTDKGRRFDAPVQVAGPGAFQARLAVAPTGRRLHAVWVQAQPSVDKVVNGFPSPPNPVVMATSADGGRSFTPPVEVSPGARQRVGVPVPVVDNNGRISVLYKDFGTDAADFEGTATSAFAGRFSLVLASSTDGGRTFRDAGVVDSGLVASAPFLVYTPQAPSLAVDRADGSLYAVWADARTGNEDVFLRRSTNGGRTWSGLVRVDDDRSGRDQYLPAVTVSPKGRVHVVYLDRRDDTANVLTGASLATSVDHGKTFAVVAVADVLSDSGVGPGSERGRADPGSRLGVVATNDKVHVVWTDSRRGTRDTGKQDIYASTVAIGAA